VSEQDDDMSDIAWVDESLETITLAIDRIAVTMSVDEFFQLRKDMDEVVRMLQESEVVQLCSYEDEAHVMRYFLMRRADHGETH